MSFGYSVRSFTTVGLAALLGLSSPALAATATGSFTVQITIQASCVFVSATSLTFTAVGVIAANDDATSTLSVQCTNTTPYNIGLSAGTGTGATVASRKMTGPAGALVNYTLYSDTNRTTVWGQTIGTDTVSASGTGAAQSYTVYGRVPVQTTPAPGAYTDTITVTVTY
ncbi:Csu type fimbrial protein [Phyllobacterium calauticae]|jgi:spore coat protein U-like protein|uniref:Csu type fimbrial protein n=1 Tax=Phyllobacterium calauticae TaxID=2817027 RepID=UPI001CBB393E|nr:spore coat U domain-containing protein [Phyllobacterium calauticae]MBZ3692946.1 spore coat U domain-containing protein [Phyllobacterium calauticae]